MKKKNKIDEIRHNKKTGHWSWLFGKKGHSRISAGITHGRTYKDQNTGKIVKTLPLPHNPNPQDLNKKGKARKVRLDPIIQTQDQRTYGNIDKTKQGWAMSQENKVVVFSHYKRQKKKAKRNKKRQT